MKYFSVALFALLIFSSCEKKEKEEASMPMGDGQFEQNELRIREKRIKGDTLALPQAKLKEYLPSTVAGYKEVEATGKEINDHGMSWSDTKKKYTSGNQTIYITLSDYNGAYGLYAGASMVLTLPDVENAEEKSESFTLSNGVKGWQSFKKPTKEVVVILAIHERFLLNIEAQNQSSTDHVRAIAESLDLSDLIEM